MCLGLLDIKRHSNLIDKIKIQIMVIQQAIYQPKTNKKLSVMLFYQENDYLCTAFYTPEPIGI